jgi:hypothetical protein
VVRIDTRVARKPIGVKKAAADRQPRTGRQVLNRGRISGLFRDEARIDPFDTPFFAKTGSQDRPGDAITAPDGLRHLRKQRKQDENWFV